MPNYTAVMHLYLRSDDYVSAIAEADDVKLAVEKIVEADIGEGMDVVEIVEADEEPIASGSIMQLRRARNILIRTKYKEAYDLARSLDEMCHVLATRVDPTMVAGTYDYSNLMRVLKEVIDGGNPLDH